MTDELERSVELLERLLGDPQLRRRFRNDAATVLTEAGLPELAAGLGHGGRALMTLEMRESRSSLAGVMVAAAAEGVDLAQFAEHAAPALARDAGQAIHQLMQQPHHAAPKPVARRGRPQPAKPSFAPPAETPTLAPPEPKAPSAGDARCPSGQTRRGGRRPLAGHSPRPPRPPRPAAMQTPSQGARLVTASEGGAGRQAGGGHGASHAQPGPVGRRSPAHPSQPADHQPAATPAPVAPEPADGGPVYPGDQATPQQIAAWMGAPRSEAGLPPELPVMAALTESGLRNLSYGDRDSVGFFQMRVGIWDRGVLRRLPEQPGASDPVVHRSRRRGQERVPGARRQPQQLG